MPTTYSLAALLLVFAVAFSSVAAQGDTAEASSIDIGTFSFINYIEGEWFANRVPHSILGGTSFSLDLQAGLSDDVLLGTVSILDNGLEDLSALLVAPPPSPSTAAAAGGSSVARVDLDAFSDNVAYQLGKSAADAPVIPTRFVSVVLRSRSTLDADVEVSSDGLKIQAEDMPGSTGGNRIVADTEFLNRRGGLTAGGGEVLEAPRGAEHNDSTIFKASLSLTYTGSQAPLYVGRGAFRFALSDTTRTLLQRNVDPAASGWELQADADVQFTLTIFNGQGAALTAVVSTRYVQRLKPEVTYSSRRSTRWMLHRVTADAKSQTLAANWKTILGTVVMLVITFGARRGGRWFLRRKGINPDAFLKGFWGRRGGKDASSVQARKLAAQRQATGYDPTRPLTAEQKARINAKADHYLKLMEEADREEGRKPTTAKKSD